MSFKATTPFVALGLALGLAAGCGGDDGNDGADDTCAPIIKFSNPVGVSPQAVDGVVGLTARVECAEDHAVWAWAEDGGEITVALDVYEHDDGGAVQVMVPVDDDETLEGCSSSVVVVAIVDDMGDVVDLDRTYVKYAIRD